MSEPKSPTVTDILGATPVDRLPVLPESTRSPDTIQWFAAMVLDNFACLNGRKSPLYLRTNKDALAFRRGNRWVQFHRGQRIEFWRAVMDAHPEVRDSNWSTKRQQLLWDYFLAYAPAGNFDDRRYFETANCVLDGVTGELDYSEERFLDKPTVRGSDLPYLPDYKPTAAWVKWHESMDEHQSVVRRWSVGAAVIGQYGLLMTQGKTRTGKSTAAEGLTEALGSGTTTFSLSQHWGNFYTHAFDNTTYLYDPDAKGSKQQNNENYETLHSMSSGDELKVEIKGGASYRTTNYGFVELISNAPIPITFEPSLVDRVRHCLYTYIDPRADGGHLKRLILADKQAWLNYAIDSAIYVVEHGRPKFDKYQMYGWVLWLQRANTYTRLCIEEGRLLSYSEYKSRNDTGLRYLITRENVVEMQEAIEQLSKQFGENFLVVNWNEYGEELKKAYYDKTTKLF